MEQETEIEIIPDTVLPVIRTLEGADAGIKVGELVELVTGEETTKPTERLMRHVITELRMRGHPVCATPSEGYFWGVTADEVENTARHLARRSLTGLTQASRMTGRTVQELAGQLALELEEAHYE
jgi:hypothetical protein